MAEGWGMHVAASTVTRSRPWARGAPQLQAAGRPAANAMARGPCVGPKGHLLAVTPRTNRRSRWTQTQRPGPGAPLLQRYVFLYRILSVWLLRAQALRA